MHFGFFPLFFTFSSVCVLFLLLLLLLLYLLYLPTSLFIGCIHRLARFKILDEVPPLFHMYPISLAEFLYTVQTYAYLCKLNSEIFFTIIKCCVNNWASEASPTLGCSIEILRDICNSYTMVVRDYR